MSILVSDKDVSNVAAATSKVIQDAIGETARVLVTPAVTSLSSAIAEGSGKLAAELAQFAKTLSTLPQTTGQAVDAALTAVDGLTVTCTVTCVVSRGKKSAAAK